VVISVAKKRMPCTTCICTHVFVQSRVIQCYVCVYIVWFMVLSVHKKCIQITISALIAVIAVTESC
jgi:hypothetical protein